MYTMDDMDKLVQLGLAKRKDRGNLSIYKYSRKAHFDRQAWADHQSLYECRGHVYDNVTREIVQIAPKKSFNYKENGHWANVPDDTLVFAFKKFNGFLACLTIHNDEWVLSTTGSLESDYTAMAAEKLHEILKYDPCDFEEFTNSNVKITKGDLVNFTVYFEICHENDPHVVTEDTGAFMLGARHKRTGTNLPTHHVLPGAGLTCMHFYEAKNLVKNSRLEGLMVFCADDYAKSHCCKLKSPYYVGKKMLIRMTPKQYEKYLDDDRHLKARIDPRFHEFMDNTVSHPHWGTLTEQERSAIIERHFDEKGW